MAKLELSHELSMSAERAWDHASNLSELGDWLVMHEGWRSELPTELTLGKRWSAWPARRAYATA